MNASTRFLLPLFSVFAIITLLIFALGGILDTYNIDKNVLLGANMLFLITNIVVFFFQKKALNNANPNVFIRSVIAGMMIKMFSCAIAVLTYVLLTGNQYNKKAVFIAMFLYLIYLAVEVAILQRLNRQKNG